ncbi:hypothetical protein LguiA_019285 [Lonicera macranthoides]
MKVMVVGAVVGRWKRKGEAILLLNFKSSVLSDTLSVLQTWNYYDQTPCSWTGVTCSTSDRRTGEYYCITGLSLSNSQLLGSIPLDLGMIRYLTSHS